MASFLTPELKNNAYRLIDKKFEIMSDNELLSLPKGDCFIADIESYLDYFFIGFKHWKTKKYIGVEESFRSKINQDKLSYMLANFTIGGFNWHGYDKMVAALFLQNRWSVYDICLMGSEIIDNKIPYWEQEDYFGVKIPAFWDSVDIMPVAPLDASLKTYSGRMHTQHMQDLPFAPKTALEAPDKAEIVGKYCFLDCDHTYDLFDKLDEQLKLRYKMSKEYGVDLRSKTDAQIAEAVIKYRLKQRGTKVEKASKVPKFVQYQKPDNVVFQTPQLQKALDDICNAKFKLNSMGKPIWPKEIGELVKKDEYEYAVYIGDTKYKLGMGGLHSQEKSISWYANEEYEIADNDVASYYPRIILNLALYPQHLGIAFLEEYDLIVGERLAAKVRSKEKTLEEALREAAKADTSTLKIVINGLFGKFGNKYSVVYSPQLLLQTTISGQLYLLMLIEMLELNGLKVVSGNTDGIVSRTLRSRRDEVRNIIKLWENFTNFETEETQYSSTHSRDVNNYIAVMAKTQYNGKGEPYEYKPSAKTSFVDMKLGAKTKGCYSERGSALNSILSKNPENLIVNDAILQYLVKGIPVDQTIKQEKDIRRFVTVRSVKGGAHKDGEYLGKTVRYYFSSSNLGCINYLTSGNKVPNSEGAKPLMDLPTTFPLDVNYEKYVSLAEDQLFKIGALKESAQVCLF